jgi:hypothetical protein
MTSNADPPLWIIPLFLIALPLVWLGVVSLLSLVSGWSALAKRFAGEVRHLSASASWCSGRMGLVAYRSALTIRVGEEGLGLSAPIFFRIRHPSLLIPWQAITRCTPGKTLFMEHLVLQIDGFSRRLVLYGRAARIVREASPNRCGGGGGGA